MPGATHLGHGGEKERQHGPEVVFIRLKGGRLEFHGFILYR